MMKLTKNNIKFVKELTCDGITYGWFVAMKSGYVSDSRNYINYENGKTTCKQTFPKNQLPKAVQKFIENSVPELFLYDEQNTYGTLAQYIYR